MNRPTVTASHQTDRHTFRTANGHRYIRPGVTVEVAFDLHDHEAALLLLNTAVEDVRAQIAEVND